MWRRATLLAQGVRVAEERLSLLLLLLRCPQDPGRRVHQRPWSGGDHHGGCGCGCVSSSASPCPCGGRGPPSSSAARPPSALQLVSLWRALTLTLTLLRPESCRSHSPSSSCPSSSSVSSLSAAHLDGPGRPALVTGDLDLETVKCEVRSGLEVRPG